MQLLAKYRFIGQWAVLFLALTLLAGAVIHNLYKSYQDIMTGEKQRLVTQVRVIDVNLSSQLHETDHVLQAIQDDLATVPVDRWPGVMVNRRLEVLVDAMSGVQTIQVVDAKGTIRFSNRKQLQGSDVSNREYFQTARQNPDPSLLIVSSPSKPCSAHGV